MRIVVIGTGNVATILARKCKEAGHSILQIYGRNEQEARRLASLVEANFTNSLNDLVTGADIYLLSVSDSAISVIAGQLNLGDGLLVHTAGSVSREVLKPASNQYGVLYPLQSLRKEMEFLPEIPLLIDGNTPEGLHTIQQLASSISDKVQQLDDNSRLHLHVAAVVVSNFTNHLYALTDDYCKKESLDFSMLFPLINEVSRRLYDFAPRTVQTGPAIRNDVTTIAKHLELLKDYPALKELYGKFSESIRSEWGRETSNVKSEK